MKILRTLIVVTLLSPALAMVSAPVFAQQQPPVEDLFTRNNDIRSLTRVIDRINIEINQSASTAILGVTGDDMTRWKAYITELRNYAAWIVAQPSPLDMPRTSHLVMDVPPSPPFEPVANQTANDVVAMLVLERYELVKSQSSGISTGLIDFDYNRLVSVLDRIDNRLLLAESGTPVIDVPQTLSDLTGSDTAASRGLSLP